MADTPPTPGARDDTGGGRDRGSTTTYPGTPRWVKVFGIILLVLLLVVVIGLVTGHAGPGLHGPHHHMPFGGAGGHTPPVAEVVQRR